MIIVPIKKEKIDKMGLAAVHDGMHKLECSKLYQGDFGGGKKKELLNFKLV